MGFSLVTLGTLTARILPFKEYQIFGFLPSVLSLPGTTGMSETGITFVAEVAPTVTWLFGPDILIAPAPYQEFGASELSHPEPA